MRSRTILVIALSLMITIPGAAQNKGKKHAPSQEEMMKRWKDAATPGDAHKVLDNFVGSWETESSVWMGGPDKPPSVTKGTAEVKWVLDGRFVQQEMTGEMMGAPMHGIGLAEAESPYPDAETTYPFRAGMCVNSDISLFGHPAGSNRIEEGFVIGTSGPESITPYIRRLCERGAVSTDELALG